ncbi:hypothetical protein ACLKA7_006960 [Drosophila subpalustris]
MFCVLNSASAWDTSEQPNSSDSQSVSVDLTSADMDNSGVPRVANGEIQPITPVVDLSELIDLTGTFDDPPIGRRRRLSQELAILDFMPSVAGPPPAKRAKEVIVLTQDDVYRCPVCLESVRHREPCTTRCGHIFCKTCIEATVRTTHRCPLCQKKITQRQLLRIYL